MLNWLVFEKFEYCFGILNWFFLFILNVILIMLNRLDFFEFILNIFFYDIFCI